MNILKIKSGPGFISGAAQQEIQRILHDVSLLVKNKHDRVEPCHLMIVEGEEDLLTLPVVAYAPVGSVVYYGQPGIAYSVPGKPYVGLDAEGIVEVVVTEEKQQEARAYLKKFVDDKVTN